MIKSAGLLIIKNNKILLVKPKNVISDNNWSIPKGIVDESQDKNIIEAAIRETFEETGILIPLKKINLSKKSIITYVDSKGLLSKIIFYFIVEISDEEYIEFKKSNSIDSSEIESFNFFSFREGRKNIYWKQQSVFNFLKQDSFCLDELELLIELGYIYKTKHPIFPLWLYNITTKCKIHKNWNYTTLSCRGLILDEAGKIIARPFKKFFERKDVYPEIIDLLPNEKIVTEKLDGALGISYKYKGNYYVCCKNNFKHYSGTIATDILYNTLYFNQLQDIEKHTVLFEIISLKVPFTLNYYSKDIIYPIGAVNKYTSNNNFKVLKKLNKPNLNFENSIKEGTVNFYCDGIMIKNKNDNFLEAYKKSKKLKERKFTFNDDKTIFNLIERRKIITHNEINNLKNFDDYNKFNLPFDKNKLNYWL